jgi:hypothetical protein
LSAFYFVLNYQYNILDSKKHLCNLPSCFKICPLINPVEYMNNTGYNKGAGMKSLVFSVLIVVALFSSFCVVTLQAFAATPPAISITTPASDGLFLTTTTPTISGTSAAGTGSITSVSWSLDGGAQTGTATGTTSWTLTIAATGQGAHSIVVTAHQSSGGLSTASTRTFTVDSIAPTGAIAINSNATYSISRNVSLNFSGVSSDVTQIQLRNGTVGNFQNAVTYANPYSYTLPNNGDGTYTVSVRFIDSAGNQSTGVISDSIILDTTSPVITIAPYGTNPTNSDITINASTNEGTLNSTSHTFTVNGNFDFVATDAAGNSTTQTVTVSNIDKTAPVISLNGVSPTNLIVGDSFTDQGAVATDNIDGTDSVTVGGDVVDTSTIGTYHLTYDAVDAAGNHAIQVIRTINVSAAPVTLTGISITHPATKLSYVVGDLLDTTDLEVTGTYSDASTSVVMPVDVTGFDSSAPVTGQVLTVSFGGQTATYAIDIVAVPIVPDTIAPTVIKLGDNSGDVALSSGNTDLVFSEVLSDSSQSVVQNALNAGADKALSYAWSGATLTITATETTTFANDVIVNISDAVGNAAMLLIVDSKLSDTQTSPDGGTGVATANSSTPQVVITNPTQAVAITIDDGTTNPTIDVSTFITGGTGTLPAISITSASANNVNVVIPASTTITSADSGWDGVIAAPTITTVTLPETPGDTKTLSTAIEVGFTGAKLSFDKGVRLLLPGQAGKRVGYVRTGATFTEIINVCSVDNQTTGDALATDGDCKIDVGSDLVVWTKHFTTFATYVQTAISIPPATSGGGVDYYYLAPTSTSTPTPIVIVPVSTPVPVSTSEKPPVENSTNKKVADRNVVSTKTISKERNLKTALSVSQAATPVKELSLQAIIGNDIASLKKTLKQIPQGLAKIFSWLLKRK